MDQVFLVESIKHMAQSSLCILKLRQLGPNRVSSRHYSGCTNHLQSKFALFRVQRVCNHQGGFAIIKLLS